MKRRCQGGPGNCHCGFAVFLPNTDRKSVFPSGDSKKEATESPTVQTFTSCTSQPEVCQCLVVQIPIENMSKHKSSTPMTHVACESELRSVVRSFIHP